MDVKAAAQKPMKMTKIGEIPEDWELRSIGSIFEFKNGLNKAKEFFGYGHPILNYMDVYNSASVRRSDIKGLVDVNNQEKKSYSVKSGDVFFTRTSETVEEIGTSCVALETVDECVFSGFVLRARPISERQDISNELKKYCFSSFPVREQIVSTSTYTTRALTNGRVLSQVLIPLPRSEEEQKAIAAALSDVDDYIRGLEKLVDKKRAIKQGAMQELLTGRRRLPGFDGEWGMISLSNLCGFTKGKGLPKSALDQSGDREAIHYGQLFTLYGSEIDEVISSCYYFDGCVLSEENDVLMPTSDVTPTGLAKASCVRKAGVVIGGDTLIIRPISERLYGPFLSLVIRQEQEQVLTLVSGTTVYHIYAADMAKFTLSCPPQLEEQKAIAETLANMDDEITALETQLDKAKQIKQAMMQELLTGRIRLI